MQVLVEAILDDEEEARHKNTIVPETQNERVTLIEDQIMEIPIKIFILFYFIG